MQPYFRGAIVLGAEVF